MIYTPDGIFPWIHPKERMIYTPDEIFPEFYPKERMIYTPGGTFSWIHPKERMVYTSDAIFPWILPKERMIYTPDGIFPEIYPKERMIYTPDGIFSWNHSEERVVIPLQYTLYQYQRNPTWASMFFWANLPLLWLPNPHFVVVFWCIGHFPCRAGSQIDSSACFVPRPCVQFGSYLNSFVVSTADVCWSLCKCLERREICASFFFHVSNQVSSFLYFKL